MYCHDTQETESSFLKALNATNTFKLDGDKLVLLDKATELATLIKGK
jgi:heat shock protein HslJ